MNKYDATDIQHLIARLHILATALTSDVQKATITIAADALDYLQDQINQYSNY